MDDKKMGGMALLIGGGAKPKADAEGDDRQAMAEKAFAKAIKSGTGIADAFKEMLEVCDGSEAEESDAEESAETDEPE